MQPGSASSPFRLPGRIQWDHDAVHVDLRPFHSRQLTRDLLTVC